MEPIAIAVIVLIAIPIGIWLLLLPCGFLVVGKRTVAIIERWGKFHKVVEEGFHFLWPCVDRIRPLRWRVIHTHDDNRTGYDCHEFALKLIDLRESIYDFPPTDMITRDNVLISVHPMILYRIVDPVRAVYEVYDLAQALSRLVQTTLRALIGDMGLDDALASRGEINRSLLAKIEDVCANWGVEVTAVEILEIVPAASVQAAMHQQISAERTRRAEVVAAQGYREEQKLLAEGECRADITRANAHARVREIEAHSIAESKKLVAKAEAKALQVLNDVVKPLGGSAADYMIGLRYIEAIRKVLSQSSQKRAYIPYPDIVGSARQCFNPTEQAAVTAK